LSKISFLVSIVGFIVSSSARNPLSLDFSIDWASSLDSISLFSLGFDVVSLVLSLIFIYLSLGFSNFVLLNYLAGDELFLDRIG